MHTAGSRSLSLLQNNKFLNDLSLSLLSGGFFYVILPADENGLAAAIFAG